MMQRIIWVTIGLALLVCGCQTTPSNGASRESKAGGPVEVSVGGEIKVRGQYLGSD